MTLTTPMGKFENSNTAKRKEQATLANAAPKTKHAILATTEGSLSANHHAAQSASKTLLRKFPRWIKSRCAENASSVSSGAIALFEVPVIILPSEFRRERDRVSSLVMTNSALVRAKVLVEIPFARR
jgi:hypothetical protein